MPPKKKRKIISAHQDNVSTSHIKKLMNEFNEALNKVRTDSHIQQQSVSLYDTFQAILNEITKIKISDVTQKHVKDAFVILLKGFYTSEYQPHLQDPEYLQDPEHPQNHLQNPTQLEATAITYEDNKKFIGLFEKWADENHSVSEKQKIFTLHQNIKESMPKDLSIEEKKDINALMKKINVRVRSGVFSETNPPPAPPPEKNLRNCFSLN
jgi:hypothetical protein